MRTGQERALRRNLRLFRFALLLVSVVVPAFMVMWALTGGIILFMAIREIASTDRPLIVNEVRTTWLGTAGFLALVCGMVIAGSIVQWLGFRYFRKTWKRMLAWTILN
jgi:hypothetical protein